MAKLYKFVGCQWQLEDAEAEIGFYSVENATNTKSIRVRVGRTIDIMPNDRSSEVAAPSERRFTFGGNGSMYSLKFPPGDALRVFQDKWLESKHHNIYGCNTQFEGGSVRNEAPEDITVSWGQHIIEARKAAITGILMGAGRNSFALRGPTVDVLCNVEGGIIGDTRSFMLVPPAGASCLKSPSKRKTRSSGVDVSEVEALHAKCAPLKVLLSHCERCMDLLTAEDCTILHHADIEAGKVVSTSTFMRDLVDVPMVDIAADYKAAQMDDHTQFLGLTQNSIGRWDTRVQGGVVQGYQSAALNYIGGHELSSSPVFTCIATSGNGNVAVGSRDGRIQLYSSRMLLQAMTSIPGLGAPVTSIDVTYDGKWVLATTDAYLMIVKAAYVNDKGHDANAFESRMGSRGTVPHLLRLKPEDVSKVQDAKLTKGKFTWITESGQSESWIVAVCGRFLVVWDFAKIKSSDAEGASTCANYTLHAVAGEEDIVDVQFMHSRYNRGNAEDCAAALVAATPHSVSCLKLCRQTNGSLCR